MNKVLITGATGNVGIEVIKMLSASTDQVEITAGVRNLSKYEERLKDFRVQTIHFDFENIDSYQSAFKHCNTLFLLRPPQIANVKRYFEPLIKTAVAEKIKHIVFLSVQGVENNKFTPHHKIERLIVQSGISYTFLHPGYFMQNFTTTLLKDVRKRQIVLPAGEARFTLIDVRDIGAVAAAILINLKKHNNKSYELQAMKNYRLKKWQLLSANILARK